MKQKNSTMNGKQLKNSILQWAIQGKLVPPACRQAGKTLTTNPKPRIEGMKCWFTYVIECEDGSFYKGYTDNLLRRYRQHCNGTGAQYTKDHKPKQLYYWEMHYSEEGALEREKYLKSGVGREWFKNEVVNKPESFEPASVLLEKIRQEKERLIKDLSADRQGKKIKRDKNASIIFRGENNSYYEKVLATGEVKCIDEEIPFEIPNGWEWCRLKQLCSMQAGKNISANKIFSDSSVSHPYRCVGGNGLRGYTEDFNTNGHYSIVGRQGALCGCVNIEKGKFYATEHAVVVDTYEILSPLFMYYFLTALNLNKYATATAQPGLAVSNVLEVMCPLPPLNEGERIIKKLTKLIPLVENFNAIQKKQNLLNNSIKERLKKSILQEAIQGKFVPQIESEDSAKELLQQIKEEKQRLVKEGKLKKSALNDSVIYKGDDNRYWEKVGNETRCIDEEIPFEIPASWTWVRINDIANLYTGNSINEKEKSTKYSGVSGREYIGTKDVGFDNVVKYDNGISIPEKYISQFRTAPKQSILLCIEGGSAGRKIAQMSKAVCFGNKLCCFDFYNLAISKYAYYYLQSPSFFENFKGNVSGIIGGVSVNRLKTLFIPLPPLAEQERIVAQIESLFAALR